MTKKQGKQANFICVILAMMIVWVGMYLQIQEIDSLFLCRPDGYATAAMYGSEVQGEDAILRPAEELTAVRDVIVRYQSVRRVLSGRGERLCVQTLMTPLMAMLLSTYLFAMTVHLGKMNASSTVILRFIHSKDGEK